MSTRERFAEVSERDRLLLRAAIGRGAPALASWRRWIDGNDLSEVSYPEGRLLSQVFSNLASQDLAAGLPSLMRGKYRWVWSNNQLRARAVAPALRALAEQGVDTLLLKGAGLIAAQHCAWGAREMGDVDLLVPTRHAGLAAAVLERLGWHGIGGVDASFIATRLLRRRNSWNFEGPPSGSLDLHWHVVDGIGGDHVDDRFWDGAHRARFGSVETRRLDDTHLIVHAVEHASHGEPAHRLLWLVDIAPLLAGADLARLRTVTAGLGIRPLVVDGLERAGWALESPTAAHLARRLAAGRRRVGERFRTLAAEGTNGRPSPVANDLLLVAAAQHASPRHPLATSRAMVGRRVEPRVRRHPLLSTALAIVGQPRRLEVALIRRAGPLSRPPTSRRLPADVWIDVTTGAMLDVVGGPGWAWPQPDGSGVWAEGPEARLVLDLDLPADGDVTLEFLLGSNTYLVRAPSVTVSVNARPVAEWDLRTGEHGPRTVAVPGWLARWCRPIEVTFRPRATRRRANRVMTNGSGLVQPGDRRQFLQLRAVRARTVAGTQSRRQEVVASWNDAARGPGAAQAIHPLGVDRAAYLESGEEAARGLAAIIGDDPDLVVVDFGCGDGRVTGPLSRRYRRVVAVDSSPAMLRRLQSQLPGVEAVVADGTDPGTLPRGVDVVVALAVLIHHRHDDAARIITGLASMLRPGGRLILDLALYEVGREPEHWTDVSVWTRAEIEMLALRLGLEIVSAEVSPGQFDGVTLGPNHGKVLVLRKV